MKILLQSLTSLTGRGGMLAIVGAMLSWIGVDVAPEDLQSLADAAFTIMAGIGGILAIAGKIRSNKRLQEGKG